MSTIPMAMRALTYTNRGLSVFPCAKKKPLTDHGLLDASKGLKQITEWWTRWPDAQIAIATGPVSNLIVLDVDGPQGFAWLSGRLIPETREVESQPGRKHFWYKLPAGRTAKNSAGVFAPEVDVRGAGGYIVAPPSLHHETGKPYRFINKLPLAVAPDWLLEPPPKTSNGNEQSSETGLVIHEGQGRHQKALQLAGGLRARGASQADILTALQIFSQQHCRPPLEPAWMEKTARYIETKPAGFRGQPLHLPAEVVVESFSAIAPEAIRWLWPGRIPAGKLTLFVGDPGKGKTLAAVDLAARMSRGHAFPDGASCERGAALILSAEDSASDTIRPRLDAADADVSRVYFIKAVKVTLEDGQTGESSFSLERDLVKLEETLKKHPGIKVIILDPLSAYLGTKVNSWRDTEVRALLTPLVEFASRTGVAIIGILHLRKSETDACCASRARLRLSPPPGWFGDSAKIPKTPRCALWSR
jgi:archaellum biogenesis ATPase FlaH